ncbi:ATP-binding cassette, subfamily B [Micrococcales bacterium KH10]|nr:ATP-binding cassette, subfamily B [Micrococcales bacterium KH10]
MTLLRLIKRFLGPHWKLLIGVIAFQFIQAIAGLYLPTLTADIIDRGVAHGDTGYVLRIGMVMIAMSFVQITASIAAVYFASKSAMKFGRDVRGALFTRVSDFSEREVAELGPASLITRSTNDVQQVQMLVQMTSTLLVSAPIMAIGGVVMALRLDVKLSGVIAVAVPLLLIAMSFIVVKMVPLFRKQQRFIDAVNRVLREQLTGIRVLRAFVRENHEQQRFDQANTDLTETATRAGQFFALTFPLVGLIMNISSVAVIWFGAFRVSDGLEVGTLFAFLSYIIQILMSVMMATFMTMMIPRASVCADRITEVLATDSTVIAPTAGQRSPRGPARLVFDHVTFQYPGAEAPVLKDVSFTVEPGTTTAIIGATGSGKTTLINLIPRLMDVTDGRITLNNANVSDLELESLWSRLGLIPQKPYLFSGTVESNLRYGNESAPDEALWQALNIAQGADFVSEMPEQLAAPITQGGTNVSGGQRQRLAIARALVKNADLYIFDDSFSALDTRTDAALRAALERELPDITKVIVAQRVATITEADQIIVLENGEIIGRGTHDELLSGNNTYREIVSSQLSAQESAQ